MLLLSETVSVKRAGVASCFDPKPERRASALYRRSQSISAAEAMARRLAMSANQKLPLSARNLMRRQHLAYTSTSRRWASVEMDDDAYYESGKEIPVVIAIDNSVENCASEPPEFEDVFFDDPFVSTCKASSPPGTGARPPVEKRGSGRLGNRTTKTKLAVHAARLSNDMALEEMWKKGKEHEAAKEVKRRSQMDYEAQTVEPGQNSLDKDPRVRRSKSLDSVTVSGQERRSSGQDVVAPPKPRTALNGAMQRACNEQGDNRDPCQPVWHGRMNDSTEEKNRIALENTSTVEYEVQLPGLGDPYSAESDCRRVSRSKSLDHDFQHERRRSCQSISASPPERNGSIVKKPKGRSETSVCHQSPWHDQDNETMQKANRSPHLDDATMLQDDDAISRPLVPCQSGPGDFRRACSSKSFEKTIVKAQRRSSARNLRASLAEQNGFGLDKAAEHGSKRDSRHTIWNDQEEEASRKLNCNPEKFAVNDQSASEQKGPDNFRRVRSSKSFEKSLAPVERLYSCRNFSALPPLTRSGSIYPSYAGVGLDEALTRQRRKSQTQTVDIHLEDSWRSMVVTEDR